MKLNLTLICILLFIIIILITFILNNNLEKFIIVQNTDNNKITDTITLPIPEISQVCTGNDCTDILWHKDCNGESYFDSECVQRRTYIFNQGKTVSGRNCHLQNYNTGCCEGQGGNGCDCDSLGKTIGNVGCGCGISKIDGCCPGQTDVGCGCNVDGQTINKSQNGCCPGISKDCSDVCGGTSVIDECGVCGGDGLSCIGTSSQDADANVGDICSSHRDCYSGICTYKTGEEWPYIKGKTCDGRSYGSPCTNYAKHCIYGHKCRDNTCGPINFGYECDGINDDRCQGGTYCKLRGWGGSKYYCADDPFYDALYEKFPIDKPIIIPPPFREDPPTATKFVNEKCSEDSECYSGICNNTCQGRPYRDYCTHPAKHCQTGHQCNNNSCGLIILTQGEKCDNLNDDRCSRRNSCQYDILTKDYICSPDPLEITYIRSFGKDLKDKNSENCDTKSYNKKYSCRDILNIHNTADSILKKEDDKYNSMKNKLTDDEYTIIKNRLEGYGYVDRCREVCNIE